MSQSPYHLFDVYGIELEYMIVDRESLDVRPIADLVLRDEASGEIVSELERGPIAWSNELVLHVLELKTNGPAEQLDGLAELFQEEVAVANQRLNEHGARLLPTAAHPWMDPDRETRLWPHEYSAIYDSFNRIFGCRGHGWSNLQSLHINLPFSGDDEFSRLHAAIRFLLPLMPALAASSPILGGEVTGRFDSRLETYRHNCRRIPQVSAAVVPDSADSEADYRRLILQPMYDAIAPHDPERILQEEWLNARGAIARFTRGSIEIRVLDLQECPRADLAVATSICRVLQHLTEGEPVASATQRNWPTERLAEVFLACVDDADLAMITDVDYLVAWGMPARPCRAGDLWRDLAGRYLDGIPCRDALENILTEGALARRMVRAISSVPARGALPMLYTDLALCLATGELFHA